MLASMLPPSRGKARTSSNLFTIFRAHLLTYHNVPFRARVPRLCFGSKSEVTAHYDKAVCPDLRARWDDCGRADTALAQRASAKGRCCTNRHADKVIAVSEPCSPRSLARNISTSLARTNRADVDTHRQE